MQPGAFSGIVIVSYSTLFGLKKHLVFTVLEETLACCGAMRLLDVMKFKILTVYCVIFILGI